MSKRYLKITIPESEMTNKSLKPPRLIATKKDFRKEGIVMANPKPRETEMHTLYLSDTVWGELKRRAVMEGSDASKLTDYVLRSFLRFMPAIELPQRRTRVETHERLSRRNLHLRKDTWARIAKVAKEKKYSISVLTEYLLRNYLGLDITNDLRSR